VIYPGSDMVLGRSSAPACKSCRSGNINEEGSAATLKYSDKVIDHFMNPRNVGELADADGIGEVGNPVCGDMLTVYIKVKDGRISDIKFKTFGCAAAIAVSSMITETAKGQTLQDAESITREAIAAKLGGLPERKMHCSNLGPDALRKAIEDYRTKVCQGAVLEKG
jgi:nitrogen fixation NifU-like protein